MFSFKITHLPVGTIQPFSRDLSRLVCGRRPQQRTTMLMRSVQSWYFLLSNNLTQIHSYLFKKNQSPTCTENPVLLICGMWLSGGMLWSHVKAWPHLLTQEGLCLYCDMDPVFQFVCVCGMPKSTSSLLHSWSATNRNRSLKTWLKHLVNL